MVELLGVVLGFSVRHPILYQSCFENVADKNIRPKNIEANNDLFNEEGIIETIE